MNNGKRRIVQNSYIVNLGLGFDSGGDIVIAELKNTKIYILRPIWPSNSKTGRHMGGGGQWI
jgi:hypothetical protein